MRAGSKKVTINGVKWEHSPEDTGNWEEWRTKLSDKRFLEVHRYYAASPMPPAGGWENYGAEEGYHVVIEYDELCVLPLDIPINEILARAIAEARLR